MTFVRLSSHASHHSVRAFWFSSTWLCLVAVTVVSLRPVHAEGAAAERETVQLIVDDSRARLSIPQEVHVSIVADNALIVSVQRQLDKDDVFQLSFEETFLRQLNDEEIRAVVAHELGHVWIFTHHPYLQTEQLANQIAMRLVPRENLEPIYDKVWKRLGTTGDLALYLGSKPTAALH